jgi:hypothetical protein
MSNEASAKVSPFDMDKEALNEYQKQQLFEDWKWVMTRVREGHGIPSGFSDPGN